jgi:NADH-quinone oxidoreductase subunit L
LGFLFALMAAWAGAQSLNLSELAGLPAPWLGWAGWGLLLAAMGKSAQGLLAGWLPDAMEGPTPVSALLHAATMVAAGVYLLARAYFLLPPSAQWLALAVGGATVVWAGLAATQQSDLKKVLAYSTVSQLGYMFLALGAGAPALALFHLFTHAFFKAVLFLSAGSVIHYVGEELRLQQSPRSPQQMANLGGLARRLPWVFVCYTLAALALAGLPFLAGFLSKELILNQLLALARGQAGGWAQGLAGFGLLAGVTGAALTAFYLAKQWWLVFVSPARWLPPPQAVAGEGHVSAWERWPLLGLSLFVPFFAFSAHPWHPEAAWLLPPLLGDGVLPPASGWLAWLTLAFTALGLGLAGWRYGGRANRSLGPGPHFGWAWLNRFTDQWLPGAGLFGSRQLARWDQRVVDGLVNYVGVAVVVAGHCSAWWDRHVVDGLVRLVARLTAQAGQLARQPQASGQVQQYYGWAVGALVAMVLGLAWWLG